MNRPDLKLSPETFERLIGRAVEIDDQGNERIDEVRAREIAAELGVSPAAWDTAIREWSEARGKVAPAAGVKLTMARLLVAAGGGGVGGVVMGMVSAASSGNDIAIGSALVAAAGGLAAHEYIRRSFRQAQSSVAVWWIAAAGGITLGLGETSSDALWYSAFSWAGCALAVTIADLVRRRTTEASKTAPTA